MRPGQRIRRDLGRIRRIDEQALRDNAIRQLRTAADLAYSLMLDERLDVKTRQAWFKTYNETVEALNQVLKDREAKDWEKRLKEIEDYRKKSSLAIQPSEPAKTERVDSGSPTGSES